MLKAFKYQLSPTKEQEILLNKHFGCCRFIYNWGLAKKIESYQLNKKILTKYDLSNMLPSMKKLPEFEWLGEVLAQSLQAKLEDLDKSFVSFFKKNSNFPKFKSKKDKQTYRIPQGIKIDWDNKKIKIYKFKEGIKFDNHRKFEGKICNSTISKSKSGKYFISILVEDNKDLPEKQSITEESTIGIDLGITNYITISTGEKIENPRHLNKKLTKLKREQRKLSRKVKESNNRNKQRIKLAKIYESVTNCRKDFQHKLSYKLTHDNQVNTIIMETLDIQNMLRNKKLARHIQYCAWNQFVSFIKYKCDWYGKIFIQIGQFEPSSRICSCGQINNDLKLNDRIWTCKSCGSVNDRDILASKNIKQIGMVYPEFTPVENDINCSLKQENLIRNN